MPKAHADGDSGRTKAGAMPHETMDHYRHWISGGSLDPSFLSSRGPEIKTWGNSAGVPTSPVSQTCTIAMSRQLLY